MIEWLGCINSDKSIRSTEIPPIFVINHVSILSVNCEYHCKISPRLSMTILSLSRISATNSNNCSRFIILVFQSSLSTSGRSRYSIWCALASFCACWSFVNSRDFLSIAMAMLSQSPSPSRFLWWISLANFLSAGSSLTRENLAGRDYVNRPDCIAIRISL